MLRSTNLWKQRMLEKLGKVEVTGESAQINHQVMLMELMKANLKTTTHHFASYIKETEATAKAGHKLSDTLLEFQKQAHEKPDFSVLAGALGTVQKFQEDFEELKARLNMTLSNDVLEHLHTVYKEFANGKAAKDRFETQRVQYDASYQKLQSLKKSKSTKPDKLQAGEDEVARNKSALEQTGREALETLIDTNSFAEGEMIERMCGLLEAYRDFFERASKALARYSSDIKEYRDYSEKRKVDLEDSQAKQRAGSVTKMKRYFGRSLAETLASDGTEIPKVISKAFEYLDNPKALGEEGLFRVSAAKSKVIALINEIDTGKDVDLKEFKPDPEVVTDVVKHFFRELPEPLLTYELYDYFIDASALETEQDKVDSFKETLKKLPPANMKLLTCLFAFLIKVAENSDRNKMGLVNLATIFGPCILVPQDSNPLSMAEDMALANVTLSFMMQKFDSIFGQTTTRKTLKPIRATAAKGLLNAMAAAESQQPTTTKTHVQPHHVQNSTTTPYHAMDKIERSATSETPTALGDSTLGFDNDNEGNQVTVMLPPRRKPPAAPTHEKENGLYHINNLTTAALPPPKRAPPLPP